MNEWNFSKFKVTIHIDIKVYLLFVFIKIKKTNIAKGRRY